MNATRAFAFVIILSLAISLSACRLNLPAPEVPTPTAGESTGATPEATGVIDTLYFIATQTALAGGPATPVVPVETTPETVLETATTAPLVTGEVTAMPTTLATPVAGPAGPQPTLVVPPSYSLHKGEHPYCLGRRFNINPSDILTANGMSTNTIFRPGMVLQIPQSGRQFPGNRVLHPHPTTYTVNTGDTIYSVACYFGDLDPALIAWANNLVEPYPLTPGQVLNIP